MGDFFAHRVRVSGETSRILSVKEPGFHNWKQTAPWEYGHWFHFLRFFPAVLLIFFTCLTQTKAREVSIFTPSLAHSCWGEVLLQTAVAYCLQEVTLANSPEIGHRAAHLPHGWCDSLVLLGCFCQISAVWTFRVCLNGNFFCVFLQSQKRKIRNLSREWWFMQQGSHQKPT